MKSIIIYALFLILSINLTACSFTNVYNDLEEDHIDGKQFLDTLYRNVKKNDFNEIVTFASDSLVRVAGKESLLKLFIFVNSKVGNFEQYKVLEVQTRRVVKRGSRVIYYRFRNKVKYQKGIVEEVLALIREDEGKIKIMSYNAYSDLLLKP